MIGQAGTLESSDIMIIVTSNVDGEGIEIDLQSQVIKQYGNRIKEVIREALLSKEITSLKVKAIDKGALDSTIRARVYAAIERAGIK